MILVIKKIHRPDDELFIQEISTEQQFYPTKEMHLHCGSKAS